MSTLNKEEMSEKITSGWTSATVQLLKILRKNNPYNLSEEDKKQLMAIRTMPDPKNNMFQFKVHSLQDS
jgi:hypothetical protein